MTKPKPKLLEGYQWQHPGQVFGDGSHKEDIRQELQRARKTQDMPDFQLDKIEFHPAKLCNIRCEWCYGKDVVPPIGKRKEISVESIEETLRDIRQNLTSQNPLVTFAGLYSEPLTHKHVSKMVNATGREGFRFGVYTNGILLTPEFSHEASTAAKENSDPRPSYIALNLTASIVRDKEGLESLFEGISELVNIRDREKSPLLINGSLLATNSRSPDQYESFLNRAKSAGLDNIRLAFPWAAQKNEENGYPLGPHRYAQFAQEFTKLQEKYSDFVSIRFPPEKTKDHCFVSTQAASISSEGDVFPCPEVSSLLFKKTHSYGNIYEEPFSKIWQGNRHKDLFRGLNPSTVEKRCVCCHMDEAVNLYCAGQYNSEE